MGEVQERANAEAEEAARREETLRKELAETRKRWQEAMKRSDALSVDMQESTAPLLRQLQSAEKQSRMRSAAWAETESNLRSELDRSLIERDKLSRNSTDAVAENRRMERLLQSRGEEVDSLTRRLGTAMEEREKLESSVRSLSLEKEGLNTRMEEMARSHADTVSQARTEMNRRALEADERRREEVRRVTEEMEEEKSGRKRVDERLKELEEERKVWKKKGERKGRYVDIVATR
mmetsp:Transcript_30612/g.70068  ORF Transcript_30612/g.70068 Transcript_30612/m.70068 type:complete len:235 (+) Transcript_30612:1700-2404(+)